MAQPGDSDHGAVRPPSAPPGAPGLPVEPGWSPPQAAQRASADWPAPDPNWQPPAWPASAAPPDAAPPSPQGPPAQRGGPPTFLDLPTAVPATKSAAGFWLAMGLVGFVVGQVVATIFLAIAGAVDGVSSSTLARYATAAAPPEWYIGTSLVGLWIGFFFGPWVASKARGTRSLVADFGIKFRPIDLAGIAIGVGGQYVIDVLYSPFIKHIKNFTAPTHKLVGAAHGWGFVAIAVLTVCGAPFFEELVFRGLAFKALARLFTPVGSGPSRRRAVGVTLAVIVDGVLFGLAHWELYQFAGLALFGMVLAIVSYRTNRLGMNMVAHASFNLVAVIAVAASSGGVVVH